jgi:hypothetical protein
MALVTIALSDDDLRLARAQAASGGFPAIEAYLQKLVVDQLQCEVDESLGAPEPLAASSVDQATALIRDGVASPSREMTPSDFASLRADLSRGYQTKAP